MATIVASIALAIFHAAIGFGLDAARQVAAAAKGCVGVTGADDAA